MTAEDLVLEEIAKARSMYFDFNKSTQVFAMMISNDHKLLEKYRKFFNGAIFAVGSQTPDLRSAINDARGAYEWMLHDREAYVFCRKLLPYLAKYDKWKFPYCQGLMMEYMTREGNPDERDDAETA